jgi:hypothetical protein
MRYFGTNLGIYFRFVYYILRGRTNLFNDS